MGTAHLKMLQLLLLLTCAEICASQNGITLSVFTVTSKSMTMQWSAYSGASSYKIKATPKNSPVPPIFVQFGQYTVIGSITSLAPNTVYKVQVEAIDTQLNVIASTETEALTAPDIPSIKMTYSKSSQSITVEFTEVSGATGYIVRAESKSGDFFSETPVSSSPGTALGLDPYTEYELAVMSVNEGGRSQPSYPVDERTVIEAPNLNTTSPTSSMIVVTWNPVDHAVLYTFVIIQEGSNLRIVKSTNDTTLILEGLEAGRNYTIKAQALDDQGRPGDDQTFSQITRPPTPDVLDVQINQGRSGAMVYWGEVQGAETYTVWSTNNQTCNATQYNFCYIIPVECGQNHTLSVTAYNKAGPSNPSQPAEYLTYPCPPNNTRVEEYNPGNCSVVWDKVQMVDFYMVYVKGNDGNEKMCNTTETRCTFDCLCGHTFISIVVPYNKVGGSPVIEIVNYTTIPCCPESINITLVSSETVEISWPEVSGAELYQVTAAETDDIIHCNDTEPVCALSDLDCDTSYSITVTPCSELRGCNTTCKAHTQVTAPCAPDIINITQVANSTTYTVYFTTPNRPGTTYTITATAAGPYQPHSCKTTQSSCELTELPCGSTYEVMGVANSNDAETSLPGYEKILETGPCCPETVEVTQVTQAMTNVSWSPATGARSFITSLSSRRGDAKCHTVDTHCLMGCITCSTNYSISMEAISSTGHVSQCNYHGFSSSPCCPTNIKLYRIPGTLSLRVYWRSLGPPIYKHSVELQGKGANLTCEAPPGSRSCDIIEESCGDVYTVLVAPVQSNGTQVSFCQKRTYSVPCPGNSNILMYGVKG